MSDCGCLVLNGTLISIPTSKAQRPWWKRGQKEYMSWRPVRAMKGCLLDAFACCICGLIAAAVTYERPV